MNFQLSEEQREIQKTALKFAVNEMLPKARAYDRESRFPKDVISKAWESGFINMSIPVDYGGIGLSSLDATLVYESLAYGCMGMTTSIMANDLALLPIVLGGNNEQKEKFLRPFTEKNLLACFNLTEPGNGSDAAGLKTLIVEDGNSWILNGEKMWITNAGYADLFTVYATIDPEKKHKGICVAVVEKNNHEGKIILGKPEDKMGHRCSDTRSVRFENVRIPKDNLLGRVGDGWNIAMKVLNHSRPMVAASAVGTSQRAFDYATTYAREREQFGKSLSSFQAVQFMIAEMAIKIEAARLLTYKAAWACDQGKPNRELASYAKAFAADSCMQITTDVVQIYGGYGYSKEYPVEKLMRDAKLLQIYEGTSQIQRLVIAKEIFSRK